MNDAGKLNAFADLDARIGGLAAEVQPALKADLQKALATLRHAHNVAGTLTTLSRLLEKSNDLLP